MANMTPRSAFHARCPLSLRDQELLREWRTHARIMQERKVLEHKQERRERHRREEVLYIMLGWHLYSLFFSVSVFLFLFVWCLIPNQRRAAKHQPEARVSLWEEIVVPLEGGFQNCLRAVRVAREADLCICFHSGWGDVEKDNFRLCRHSIETVAIRSSDRPC